MRPATFALLLLAVSAGDAAARCEGCGCRGGLGYRSSSGKCVGHQQLLAVCGTPPTTKCTFEGAAFGILPWQPPAKEAAEAGAQPPRAEPGSSGAAGSGKR